MAELSHKNTKRRHSSDGNISGQPLKQLKVNTPLPPKLRNGLVKLPQYISAVHKKDTPLEPKIVLNLIAEWMFSKPLTDKHCQKYLDDFQSLAMLKEAWTTQSYLEVVEGVSNMTILCIQ